MDIKNLIIIAAFTVSGIAALIYEVVWFRPLSLIFGSTVYAISTMLTAFMAGLSLGSWIMSKYTDKLKNPLFTFSVLELGIGIYGILIISLFNLLPYAYIAAWNTFHFSFGIFSFVQFLLAFLVMLVPTTLMGATWPVINKAFIRQIDVLGRGTGVLYSANSFGAILGSFSAGFILIPLLGVKNSSVFAAFLNLIAAVAVFYLSRRRRIEE